MSTRALKRETIGLTSPSRINAAGPLAAMQAHRVRYHRWQFARTGGDACGGGYLPWTRPFRRTACPLFSCGVTGKHAEGVETIHPIETTPASPKSPTS